MRSFKGNAIHHFDSADVFWFKIPEKNDSHVSTSLDVPVESSPAQELTPFNLSKTNENPDPAVSCKFTHHPTTFYRFVWNTCFSCEGFRNNPTKPYWGPNTAAMIPRSLQNKPEAQKRNHWMMWYGLTTFFHICVSLPVTRYKSEWVKLGEKYLVLARINRCSVDHRSRKGLQSTLCGDPVSWSATDQSWLVFPFHPLALCRSPRCF